jgi:hypothetical protein
MTTSSIAALRASFGRRAHSSQVDETYETIAIDDRAAGSY